MTESDPHELIGKRIRVKTDHPQTPAGMAGLEGIVTDVRELEPADDDVVEFQLDDGSRKWCPVDAVEVLP